LELLVSCILIQPRAIGKPKLGFRVRSSISDYPDPVAKLRRAINFRDQEKKMITRTSLVLAAALSAGLVHAGGVNYHYAPVVSVKPEYQTQRTPVDRQVCWDEQVYERTTPRHSSRTPTVVGAIIGGVIGNQFGGGSGKKAATVAGAALGGSIGRDASRQSRGPDQYRQVSQERCTVQRDYTQKTVITGYQVGYEYDGQVYHTRMNHHPGDAIRVRVAVSPAP
jgi:uncharacterized protein YcfJ